MPSERLDARGYWRANLRLLFVLLVIWALVSFGGGIFFADSLNRFSVGGYPLGFFFAQQGAIYVFIVQIFVFSKRVNRAGAIAGMLAGLTSTLMYIFIYKGWFFMPGSNWLPDDAAYWVFGIQPESFGAVGALINFAVALLVSWLSAPPPEHIQELVDRIRLPQDNRQAVHPLLGSSRR